MRMFDDVPAAYATNLPSGESAGLICSPASVVNCDDLPSVNDGPCVRVAQYVPTPSTASTRSPATIVHARERDALTAGMRAAVGAVPLLGVDSGSSAASNSAALCQRSAGRFSRQRITACAS